MVLNNNAWYATQRSLGWANDGMGFAVAVHIVFTTMDLGRGPLAFPIGNQIWDVTGVGETGHAVH